MLKDSKLILFGAFIALLASACVAETTSETRAETEDSTVDQDVDQGDSDSGKDDEPEEVEYNYPEDGYQLADANGIKFQYPADWVDFEDKDSLDEAFKQNPELAQGLDRQTIEATLDLIDIFVIAPDASSNINVIGQTVGNSVNIDDVPAAVAPQISGLGEETDQQFVDTVVGKAWYVDLTSNVSSPATGEKLYLTSASVLNDGKLHTVTITSQTEDSREELRESFFKSLASS